MAKQKKRTIKFNSKKQPTVRKPKAKTKHSKAKKPSATVPKKAPQPLPDSDDEPEQQDDIDVDDFLNGGFMDSDNEEAEEDIDQEQDDDDDASSSEDEDEDAIEWYNQKGPQAGADDNEEEDASEKPVKQGKKEEEDHQEDDDDADDMEVDNEDDEEREEDDNNEQVATPGAQVVTMEMLKSLEEKAFKQNSPKLWRRLLAMFADACRESDETRKAKFSIQSSAVYNRLMVNVFRRFHEMYKVKQNPVLLRTFITSTIALLKKLTDSEIQQFVLRELAAYIPFLVEEVSFARKLLQILLLKWSSIVRSSTGDNAVCMLAFLRIRDLALAMPFPFIEMCLKGLYLSYHRSTKFTNEAVLSAHTLMGNCVVELYSLDLASSYQHAFVYIRQLALTLRRAIVAKTPDAAKDVLCWQFCNALRVWTAVVCAHPKNEHSAGLQALVYPLCQILYATIRLIPTARYFPLRFHCVSMLQQIAASTNTFVPTAPVLLDVLNSTDLRKRSKGSMAKPMELKQTIKLSKTALDTAIMKDAIVARALALLSSEMDIYKYNIGFPEMIAPLQMSLKKFISSVRVPKWTIVAKGLLQTTKKRADWIISKRTAVEFCPKDITEMDNFMQKEAKIEKQRIAKELVKSSEIVPDSPAAKPQEKPKKAKKQAKPVEAKADIDPAMEVRKQRIALMDREEFSKAVQEVDEEDEVGELNWSSDEE